MPVPIEEPDPRLFSLVGRARWTPEDRTERAWLNVANPDEAAYVAMMGATTSRTSRRASTCYFLISETAPRKSSSGPPTSCTRCSCTRPTTCCATTRCSSASTSRASLWPKIHQSWDNRRNQMITGRFDFAMTERGLKVYEYNCDSAACHMECGQGAGQVGAALRVRRSARDPGEDLHDRLRDAWRQERASTACSTSCRTDDLEETYHALFMQEAMERGGHREPSDPRASTGSHWADDGGILDARGRAASAGSGRPGPGRRRSTRSARECDDDEEKLRELPAGRAVTTGRRASSTCCCAAR